MIFFPRLSLFSLANIVTKLTPIGRNYHGILSKRPHSELPQTHGRYQLRSNVEFDQEGTETKVN